MTLHVAHAQVRHHTAPARAVLNRRERGMDKMTGARAVEAHAQGGGEVAGYVGGGDARADGRFMLYVVADSLPPVGTKLYTAPTSAPVGVEDGPTGASDNAEYIEHCADRLERCGLRVTAGALRVIAHEHRSLAQKPAAEVYVNFPQVGTAGPFAVVDGKVTLPDTTMNDLIRHARTGYVEQPAAVDGDVIVIDGRRYAVETVRTALLGLAADVARALAAQPGGSDNDR